MPVGTSEYQAAWILDGDEDEDSKADGDNQESDDEDEDMDDELDVLSPAEGTKLLSDDEFEQVGYKKWHTKKKLYINKNCIGQDIGVEIRIPDNPVMKYRI